VVSAEGFGNGAFEVAVAGNVTLNHQWFRFTGGYNFRGQAFE
jgi:hypothetical protein